MAATVSSYSDDMQPLTYFESDVSSMKAADSLKLHL